jgi:hypothetical protein
MTATPAPVSTVDGVANGAGVDAWRALLMDPSKVAPEATWDLIAYSRFLAARLPEAGALGPGDAARLAEDLIADLKEGIDRRAQRTFDPPLVSDRSDLLYNYFRENLELFAKQAGGDAYAKAFASELKPVLIAPPPKPAAPEPAKPEAPKPEAPAKPEVPAPKSETPAAS